MRWEEARVAYVEARDAARRTGDATLEALSVLGPMTINVLGDVNLAELVAAITLLDGSDPSEDRALGFVSAASLCLFAGDAHRAKELAERALVAYRQIGLEPAGSALTIRGGARIEVGERDGIEDLAKGLARSLTEDVADAVGAYNELAIATMALKGPGPAWEAARDGSALARRCGSADGELLTMDTSVDLLFYLGRWDEVISTVGSMHDIVQRGMSEEHFAVQGVSIVRSLIELLRGSGADVGTVQHIYEQAGEDAQFIPRIGCVLVRAFLAADRRDDAVAVLRDVLSVRAGSQAVHVIARLPDLVSLSLQAGEWDIAKSLAEGIDTPFPLHNLVSRTCDAFLKEADGAIETAAVALADLETEWSEFGDAWHMTHTLQALARCRIALGQQDAEATSERAHAALRILGVRAI
jgi:hypothetical protein